MKKLKILMPILGISTITTAIIPLASCGGNEDKNIKVTSVTINEGPTTEITVGNKLTLTAKVLPSNATDKSLTWSSSAPEKVKVDASTGEIEALEVTESLVTITAKAKDGSQVKGECKITVNPKTVQDITLSSTKIDNLALDSTEPTEMTAQISATLSYNAFNEEDEITWTIDETGKDFIQLSKDKSVSAEVITITPLKMGVATLTASCKGKTATCTIDVGYNQNVVVVGDIVYGNLTGIYNNGGTRNITGKAINANADDLNVSSKTFNEQVVIGKKVSNIDDHFLNSCLAFNQPLTIPDSVTIIGGNFLYNCQQFNQSITLSNNLKEIGASFLGGAAFNQTITIPGSVEKIGMYFSTKIPTIKIGANSQLKSIGYFWGIKDKTFDLTESGITYENGFMYNANTKSALGATNDFDGNIPAGTLTIGAGFLLDAQNFNNKVNIPNTVTTIGDNFMSNCQVFNQQLSIPNSVQSIGTHFMSNCKVFNNGESAGASTKPFTIPNITEIKLGFMHYCQAFNQPINIPNTVTSIGGFFLAQCKVFNQAITLHDNITSIGASFLGSCAAFNQEITLTNNLTTIDSNFMSSCTAFNNNGKTFTIPSQVVYIKGGFLSSCSAFTQTIKFNANSQLKEFPGYDDSARTYDFTGSGISLSNGLLYNSTSKSALTATDDFNGNIPDGCTYIASSFLSGKTPSAEVTQIKIPDTVTVIGDEFMSWCMPECENLDIIISKNLTKIGNSFMSNCWYPEGGTTIDFSGITNPDNLTIDGTNMLAESYYTLTIKVASGTTTAWRTKILAATGLSEWPEAWTLTDQ